MSDDRVPVTGSGSFPVRALWHWQADVLEALRPRVTMTGFGHTARCGGKCGRVLAHHIELVLDDGGRMDGAYIYFPLTPGEVTLVDAESGAVLRDITFVGGVGGAPGKPADRGTVPEIVLADRDGAENTPFRLTCGSHGDRGTTTIAELGRGSIRR